MYERNIEDRFWGKVDKKGPDECWPWLATIGKNGYGGFHYRDKRMNSHKVAYILTYGEVPKGLWVLHKCSNYICCNPNHLYAGTPADNERDAKESNITFYPYKLNPEEMRQVKDLRRIFTLDKIAKMYNVSISAIWKYCKA